MPPSLAAYGPENQAHPGALAKCLPLGRIIDDWSCISRQRLYRTTIPSHPFPAVSHSASSRGGYPGPGPYAATDGGIRAPQGRVQARPGPGYPPRERTKWQTLRNRLPWTDRNRTDSDPRTRCRSGSPPARTCCPSARVAGRLPSVCCMVCPSCHPECPPGCAELV